MEWSYFYKNLFDCHPVQKVPLSEKLKFRIFTLKHVEISKVVKKTVI